MVDQFDKIYCRVELSWYHYSTLLDRVKFSKNLTRKASSHLRLLGVRVVPKPLVSIGPMGGGRGPENLLDPIIFAWENQAYLSLFISFVIVFIRGINILLPWAHNRSIKFKLRADVALDIRITIKLETYEKGYLQDTISDRLLELKYLADDLCSKLSNEFPSIHFNQIISATIDSKNFNISYNTKSENLGKINSLHTLKLINNLRVKNRTEVSYHINKILIKRVEYGVRFTKPTWTYDENERKYYFFLSSKLFLE